MELVEAGVQIVFRLLAYIGMVDFFLWFEKWVHKNLFPKSWQNNIGYNSDLMHIIVILIWMTITAFVIFIGIQIVDFVETDA